MPTKDFSYALVSQGAETGTIRVDGPGAPEIMAIVEKAVRDHMKEAVATGREVIDFLTTFNGGHSNVENSDQIQDSTGGWLLKLDTVYSLASFGTINWEDQTQPLEEALQAWRRAQVRADPRRSSPRYPYTYAADVIRMVGPHERVEREGDPPMRTPKLSRSDASELQEGLAPVLRVERHELAEMLADYYLAHETELLDAAVARVGSLK
jgi:hypothetical protein